MRERKDVYKLPAGDKTLEWYSKAVLEMKKRPTTDPTSWNYQGAIHGFDATNPFWNGAAPLPSPQEQLDFWKQCQHGSWYFLPWHRMYLAYFEQIVAKVIVDLGGPADWALPYWNYSDNSNPNARVIPPAFTNPNNVTNGLWIAGRQSNTIPARYVTLGALNTIPFTGDGIQSPLGFGGPKTSFSHSGRTHGELESLPHDMVHVAIGGAMGNPRTAALDPIFWLHHANIDRLWQVWLNLGRRYNPTESAWQDLKFYFHDQNRKVVSLTSLQVEDTRKVLSGYTYQGVPVKTSSLRNVNKIAYFKEFKRPLEVVAATNSKQLLEGSKKMVPLKITPSRRMKSNFMPLNESLKTPKRTILHFENVTGKGVPPIHDVYVNVPEKGGDKESFYAGSLSFFGVEEASTPSAHQAGSGQHYALDVSDLMNRLRSLPNWDENAMNVSIEPSQEINDKASVSIGRISVYSE